MENMENEVMSLIEDTVAENVIVNSNLSRTKGFLLGAGIVGVSWLATSLFKKYKRKLHIEAEEAFETAFSKVVEEKIED